MTAGCQHVLRNHYPNVPAWPTTDNPNQSGLDHFQVDRGDATIPREGWVYPLHLVDKPVWRETYSGERHSNSSRMVIKVSIGIPGYPCMVFDNAEHLFSIQVLQSHANLEDVAIQNPQFEVIGVR